MGFRTVIIGISFVLSVSCLQARRMRAPYRALAPISISEKLPSIEKIAQKIVAPIGAENFLFGASCSEHQSSKQCTKEVCSASRWAHQHGYELPTDTQYSMNWWDHYRQYIDDAVEKLGVNSLRFSIEMALVQPGGPDSWDEHAIRHYQNLFTYCLKKGVTPLVTFHHYTDPNWFVDKGGFEEEANIDYFVAQCVRVYKALITATRKDTFALLGLKNMLPREPLWITFNAPEAYAFRGYYTGAGAPSIPEKTGLKYVANVIKNCCEATVRVSKALKMVFAEMNLPFMFSEPKIGFLKNIHQVDAARNSFGQKLKANMTNFMIGFADQIRNNAIFDFFTTGQFKTTMPFAKVKHINKEAVGSLDFIGLNYYSNRYMSLTSPISLEDEMMQTDSEYYIYPEGMFRAISQMYEKFIWPYEATTQKKLPLFVAENGIATNNNEKRSRFYTQYLYAISQAVAAGYLIFGYTPWALFDNYEWPRIGTCKRRNYGIFSVSSDGSSLELKEGSLPLKQFSQALC